MNERRRRIMKRLVLEELERRELLAGDPISNNDLELNSLLNATTDDPTPVRGSEAPESTSGVGQQTITTGANTLGIGSFATATNGPSRAGGTGNPNLAQLSELAARDQALEELFDDLHATSLAKALDLPGAAAQSESPVSDQQPLGTEVSRPDAWGKAADEPQSDQPALPGILMNRTPDYGQPAFGQ